MKNEDTELMVERMENRIEPESRFNPELIEELEKTSLLIDQEKVILLLTLMGEKPAAHHGLLLKFGAEQESNEKKFIAEKQFLTEWLQKAGLIFSVKDKTIRGGVRGDFKPTAKVCNFHISRDKAALERLNHAHSKSELGLALGYPTTAVEAYLKGQEFLIKEQDLPFDIRSSEVMDFLFFRLSKEHWAEELETVKRWAKAIKDNFPDFYQQVIDLRPKIDALRSENPEGFQQLLRSEEKMAIVKQRDPELYQELQKEKEMIKRSD